MTKRLLFIGDSITDAGRTNHCPPLGEGFVAMTKEKLTSPDEWEILNQGISANSIEGLHLRWDRDVIANKPDLLIILIGINDAHVTLNLGKAVVDRVQHFKKLYIDVIEKSFRELPSIKITLMTPFLIRRPSQDRIGEITEQYVEAVRELARDFDMPLIDLQVHFEQALGSYDPFDLSLDTVHPTPTGHQLIADQICHHLEPSGE